MRSAATDRLHTVPGQFRQQFLSRLRSRNLAVQDFLMSGVGAVHGFVPAMIGLDYSAIHADTGKTPLLRE